MMAYILIIYIYSTAGITAITSAEFSSNDTCEAAAKELVGSMIARAHYVCVKK